MYQIESTRDSFSCKTPGSIYCRYPGSCSKKRNKEIGMTEIQIIDRGSFLVRQVVAIDDNGNTLYVVGGKKYFDKKNNNKKMNLWPQASDLDELL